MYHELNSFACVLLVKIEKIAIYMYEQTSACMCTIIYA